MKNFIITSISLLALALTGCGEGSGSVSTDNQSTDLSNPSAGGTQNITVNTVSDDSVAIVNHNIPNVGNLPEIPVLPGQ